MEEFVDGRKEQKRRVKERKKGKRKKVKIREEKRNRKGTKRHDVGRADTRNRVHSPWHRRQGPSIKAGACGQGVLSRGTS